MRKYKYPRNQRKNKKTPTDKHIKTVVRREINKNMEMKCKETFWDEMALSTVSQGDNWYDPLYIGQGVGSHERIGIEISLKGLHLRGILHNNGTTVNYVRLIVAWSHDQSNMASSQDIFRTTGGGSATTSSIVGLNCMYYPLNKNLLTVVYNKVFKLAPSTDTSGKNITFFNKFLKFNRKIIYEAAGLAGDSVHPRLHIGWIAAEGPDDTGSGQTVEVSGIYRTYFYDG